MQNARPEGGAMRTTYVDVLDYLALVKQFWEWKVKSIEEDIFITKIKLGALEDLKEKIKAKENEL